MKTESPFFYYFRIVLISCFIAILGLGPIPHAASTLLGKAYQAISKGDTLTASQDLAQVAEYYPWRYELNLQAGKYAMQAGDPDAAIEYLQRPGTVTQLSTDDMVLLGDAYEQSGDPYMAEAIWKRVTQLDNSSPALERLSNLYLQRKDYDSAVIVLEKLLALNPANTRLYYQVGTMYAATEPIKSLPFLIQAVEIDPLHATQAQTLHDKIRTANLFAEPAYTLLISGRQLANSGEWDLASAAFLHAIDLRPDYADAWAFLGEAQQQIALKETGSISSLGLPALERAIHLDENSVLANTFMGLYWERQQDYAQAQSYLERAIINNPTDPFLYSELANILSKAGDLPAAETRYEEAIKLAPQDPLFYCLLAEFALEQQIQIRELALPAARQAVNLDPKDVRSLDVMAQVMLMLQDYHSAERFSLMALQVDPEYAAAYLHLGTAYIFLQEPELARQFLDKAKAVGNGMWIASQAERMLDYYFP